MTELVRTSCCACGIEFSIPKILYDARKAKPGEFFCPNGHSLHYCDTELERVTRERDRLRQRLAESAEAEAKAEQARIKAEKETKRLKRRASGGVCPCCNRTFSNMARHMRSQHPEQFPKPKAVKLP